MTTSPQWNLNSRQRWLHGEFPDRPVDFDEQTGLWRVFGHREATKVFADTTTYSSNTSLALGVESEFSEGNLVEMDPPAHGKLRRLASHAFTPKVVAGLEPRIRQITRQLLDEMDCRTTADLVTDLAYPLPVTVIAELLGIPASDQTLFKKWVDAMTASTHEFSVAEVSGTQDEVMEHALEQMRYLQEYILQHVVERRTSPRDDLITGLVQAEVDGQRLSDREVATFANVLLGNGHITTTLLLSNTVLLLDNHPDALHRVLADPAAGFPAAIEEALRYLTPAPVQGRATTSEASLGDLRIPAGQLVQIWVGAANRDPSVFPDPHTFDITRDPNPHLAFGRGIHFCLGAPLARLEAKVAMTELYQRFPGIRTTPEAPPVFQSSPYVTGLSALPVLLN
ncbi:cytochrome P450 [Lentzea jiangxiensis]|uniref:Cytochrome P450 n=1 Tax=Lentzea jiangxiensis TaxID=641025 RepID=A0A1H0WUI2_9PSEU|nr:cytochrome P450 [Lentzea jiangxiensis]SDP94230.1 Cytochrome P450 [Lentzea jiangxiensis]